MTIPSELKKNEIYPARITGYTSEGAGVCRIGERAVFVPGTIVGEEWDVRIVRSTSAAVWGRGETLRSPSPHRAEPDCPADPRCGGCALRHMDYEEELSLKLQRVNDALHRIGKLCKRDIRFRHMTGDCSVSRLEETFKEHLAIITPCIQKNWEEAAEKMRIHIQESKKAAFNLVFTNNVGMMTF